MPRDIKYYKDKLTTLRNVLDGLLVEMEAEPAATPRKRRNLKAERVMKIVNGRIVKSAYLKTKKRA